MRVAVTGSTSVIGQRLVAKLSEAGHTPIPFGGSESDIWRIGKACPIGLDLDALVHLAHDRSFSVKENVDAARVLCGSFKGRKIFLSSFSAHSKSISKYGQSKYAIESIFNTSNGSSLRAGVVYGGKAGGIFAQIEFLIKKLPLIPLPYRGSSLLFTTHIDDLVSEIIVNLDQNQGLTTFAANSTPITLENLSFQIQKALDLRKSTISISRQPLDILLKLLVRLLPNFTMADSLLSLSREANYEEISKLKIPHSNFREFKLVDRRINPNP
jgi:nucleoside-diphosphate-sugar epimerase